MRVLAIIEAKTITGPAKNLLSFADMARPGRTDPGVEVSIAVFTRQGDSPIFLDRVRELSIPAYPVPEARRFDRAVLQHLRRLMRELQPDLVQSHAVKSHFLVRMAGLCKLAPWIAFHHGYTWTDRTTHLYNQLDRWSLRAADRIVTVSQPFREQLVRIGVDHQRIEVLHNAVKPDWGARYRSPESRSRLRAELGISPDARVIIIVGRLSHEKDHQTLLRAIHILQTRLSAANRAPLHLLIIGDGPERSAIEATIVRLGLQSSVTLIGQVPSAEPYYGLADVSVLSSLTEGSPNALLESMAARVPAVATAVGGVPEIASDKESALLIRTHDAEQMADAIAAVLSDSALAQCLAEKAYATILERFTPERRVKQLIGIYQDVLSSPHRNKPQPVFEESERSAG